MPPSLTDIDAKLAVLTSASSSIDAKLAELDETIKTFTSAGLTGRSAVEWGTVAPKCGELWRYFLVLRGKVQEAVTVRGTKASVPKEQLDDLAGRLFTDSVTLPEVPSALLSTVLIDTSRTVSMDRVVALLSAMYEEVATVANRIVQAWETSGPRVAELETALAALSADARRSGLAVPAVDAVQQRLTSVKASLAKDPLGVDGSVLTELARQVAEARVSLQHLVRARDGLTDRIAASRRALDTLGQELDDARALREEVAVKITGAAGQLPDLTPLASHLPGLRTRLDEIAGQAGDWQRASTLLDAVDAQVAAVRATIFRAATDCRGWMDRRNELRGLLDGYRAKANATGRGEDAALSSLFDRARDALYTAPCDVDAAADLVRSYQQALNQRHEA